jgi:lysophospholipase L1-like esterase
VPFNGNTAKRNAIIALANQRLKQIAAQPGVAYVDYHSRLVHEDGVTLRPGLADDGLHPHVIGYQIMADVLVEALARAGITSIARR